MVNIIYGTTKKPISAQRLISFFTKNAEYEGTLYIGYPIIGTTDGPYPIDALLISKEKGVIIFNLVEGKDLANYAEIQDESFNKLDSKLRGYKQLMKGRELQVKINVITFAPAAQLPVFGRDNPLCNEENIKSWLDTLFWENQSYYSNLLSTIQTISSIRKGLKKREPLKEDSRGARLKFLEDSIANLDNLQGRAVIETVDGVQRIRGLAGSGKTIVLALKAAYLHAQHPDWKIAVTFNTRSLKGQFKRLINTFVIEQTNEEPDWENIHIIHAWGAPGGGERNGLYYSFCQHHGIECYDFGSAKMLWRGREFEGVCQKALAERKKEINIYDAILVDEAQDFPPAFLLMCFEMLKSDKRLVYAYDELQNLSSEPLPSPEEIFGKDNTGKPRVQFGPSQPGKPKQDIILDKCYRNSRPVLVTAHALGFGIFRKPNPDIGTGLVQIFDREELWGDVGYEVAEGKIAPGSDVTLKRSSESSPEFLEEHSLIDDLIQFKKFESSEAQDNWVATSIIENLKQDELRPDDIVVINPNPLTTRRAFGEIRKLLFNEKINSHLAGVDTSPDVFFDSEKESIVFTGIYRAKGNEAGMVYIVNAHENFSSPFNSAAIRNRLFTAITRGKAWVRVCGVGSEMDELIAEFNQLKKNEFMLKFKYPTEEQKKRLFIINRDMSIEEQGRVKKKKDDLKTLLDDIEAGRVYIEDLGDEQIKRLKKLLNSSQE